MKSKALDTMTWVDLSKQLQDSIGMTKHLVLAPAKDKNGIACASSKSFLLAFLNNAKHTGPGCSLKKFVNKMLWLKVKNLRTVEKLRMTDTTLILAKGGDSTLIAKQHF